MTDSDHSTKNVNVNLFEMITLNEIKLKHHKMALDSADQFLSILMEISNITPKTSVEELEQKQNHLRAIMNDMEQQLKEIVKDKLFVEAIMKRNNLDTSEANHGKLQG